MIFDAILIILLYTSFQKAGLKGCTDDLNFSLGFLISVRIAGAFYEVIAGVLQNFINNAESLTVYSSYAIVLFFVLYLYNSILGKHIIEFGKKVPKKTGSLLTYIFAVFKTIIIYSIVFSFLYTIPLIQSIKNKNPTLIKPFSYQLTYGVIGYRSEKILDRIRTNLLEINLGFFKKQEKVYEKGASKTLDAVKQNKELKGFINEEEDNKTTE